MTERIHVVGAGLAGLTAAINLAREGFRVVVHEKQAKVGGRQAFRPDPAGSPFDLGRLARYTGIDITPAVYPLSESRYNLWGESYRVSFPGSVTCFMVERGRRKTSLDTFLYDLALQAGATFSFGECLASRSDFEALPPGSILATGLEEGSFETLGIPCEPAYAWCGKGRVPFQEPSVTIYLGPFTKDYGFSCTVNGVALGFLFQRSNPLTEADQAAFQSLVEASERYTLKGWKEAGFGACPSRSIRNPRLFWEDKILAGSVGGNMDPLMNFGMLPAMLSGKIAATAVSRPRKALREFRRLNVSFYPLYVARRLLLRAPEPGRAWLGKRFVETVSRLPDLAQRPIFFFVPGYGRMG